MTRDEATLDRINRLADDALKSAPDLATYDKEATIRILNGIHSLYTWYQDPTLADPL